MCHIFFPSWLPHQRQALDCLQTRECFANLDLDASSAWWSNVSILPTAKGWQFHPALTNLGLICTQRPLPVPYALRTCCYTGEPWSSCNSYIQLNQNWNYCIPKNKTYSRYWLHRFVGALFGTPGSMGNVLSTYIEPHHISWHFSKTKFFEQWRWYIKLRPKHWCKPHEKWSWLRHDIAMIYSESWPGNQVITLAAQPSPWSLPHARPWDNQYTKPCARRMGLVGSGGSTPWPRQGRDCQKIL